MQNKSLSFSTFIFQPRLSYLLSPIFNRSSCDFIFAIHVIICFKISHFHHYFSFIPFLIPMFISSFNAMPFSNSSPHGISLTFSQPTLVNDPLLWALLEFNFCSFQAIFFYPREFADFRKKIFFLLKNMSISLEFYFRNA